MSKYGGNKDLDDNDKIVPPACSPSVIKRGKSISHELQYACLLTHQRDLLYMLNYFRVDFSRGHCFPFLHTSSPLTDEI